MNTTLKYESLLPLIPGKPGIYQFVDAYGNVIYIGKAKNLKKRVASYFSKNQSGKTSVMLRRAAISGILLLKVNQMRCCSRITS
jgi:excinuclease ABC subunit C